MNNITNINELRVGDKVLIKFKGIGLQDTVMQISKNYVCGEKYDLTQFILNGRVFKINN